MLKMLCAWKVSTNSYGVNLGINGLSMLGDTRQNLGSTRVRLAKGTSVSRTILHEKCNNCYNKTHYIEEH